MPSRPLYFEDVDIGDELPALEKAPTPEAVRQFVGVASDPAPRFFTDAEAARQVGFFEEPVVPGDMSMAYLANAVTHWAPNATVKSVDALFRRPVSHLRRLRITGLVTDKGEAGDNTVTCDLYLLSEEGERLVGGTAVVVLPSRKEASPK